MKRRTLLKGMLAGGALFFLPRQVAQACVTTADIEGPFYIPGSRLTSTLAPAGAAGDRLFITGTVYARDCQTPIPNALVDVWHASDGGDYDNTDYRGRMRTGSNGAYAYDTVLPGKYFNGSQYRPRHLHYKVNAPDQPVLTTQVYFQGDTSIPADPWASEPDAQDRIIPLTTDQQGRYHGVADVYLNVDPQTVGIEESQAPLHSHILSIFPNPVQEQGVVKISLTTPARTELRLLDLTGREISKQQFKNLPAGTHEFPFSRTTPLGLAAASGIYILKLLVDGAPTDAKRVYFR